MAPFILIGTFSAYGSGSALPAPVGARAYFAHPVATRRTLPSRLQPLCYLRQNTIDDIPLMPRLSRPGTGK
jgi:hypothetical protein